jgi:hypothetical protein
VEPTIHPLIRAARPGDGQALARIWLENARYYVDRFPDEATPAA